MGINVILDRCQRWRHNRAECSLCLKACPVEGCIRFDDDRTIHINNETCLTCGICAAECPTHALTIDGLTGSDLWEKLRSDAKTLVFACTLSNIVNDTRVGCHAYRCDLPEPAPLKISTLPCLSVLDESILASLALSGAEKIYLDLTPCKDCGILQGNRIIEKNVSHARSLLSALGHNDVILTDIPKTITPGNKVKASNIMSITHGKSYSRRELFTNLICSRNDKAAVIDNELPHDRQILIDALRRDERAPLSFLNEGEFPVHQLAINDNCTICYSCELYCPAGALRRVENAEEARIDFRASLCMGCYQCRELCHRDAIQYREHISLGALITDKTEILIRKTMSNCSVCGKSYISEGTGDTCLKCVKKAHVEKDIMSILTRGGGEE